MLYRSASILAILGLAASFTGCASTDEGDCKYITETGAVIGGVAGAGVGAAIAEWGVRSWDTLDGAGVGFAVGGLLGAIIGDQIEDACYEDQIAKLRKERDDLAAQLQACQGENAKLKAEIDRLNARIKELEAATPASTPAGRIALDNNVLFDSGKADLKAEGKALLDEVANELKTNYAGKKIAIDGHTDTDPIRASGWKSNWELGAARALAVLHYLEDKGGIAGENLSAATYSYHRKVAENDTAEGKAKNRRSEIVIWAE